MGCPYKYDPTHYAVGLGQQGEVDYNDPHIKALKAGNVGICAPANCVYVCAIFPRDTTKKLQLLREELRLLQEQIATLEAQL